MSDQNDNHPSDPDDRDLDDWLAFLAGQRPHGFSPDAMDGELRDVILRHVPELTGTTQADHDELGWQRMKQRLQAEGLHTGRTATKAPRYVWPSMGIAASALLAALLLNQPPLDVPMPVETRLNSQIEYQREFAVDAPADAEGDAAIESDIAAAPSASTAGRAVDEIARPKAPAEAQRIDAPTASITAKAAEAFADGKDDRDRNKRFSRLESRKLETTPQRQATADREAARREVPAVQLEFATSDPRAEQLRRDIGATPTLTIVSRDTHSLRITWTDEHARQQLIGLLSAHVSDLSIPARGPVELRFKQPAGDRPAASRDADADTETEINTGVDTQTDGAQK